MNWFASFSSERTQCVHIGGGSSLPIHIDSGVPQGSVVGCPLFTSYISPVYDIICRHGLLSQAFADDWKVFRSTPTTITNSDPSTRLKNVYETSLPGCDPSVFNLTRLSWKCFPSFHLYEDQYQQIFNFLLVTQPSAPLYLLEIWVS